MKFEGQIEINRSLEEVAKLFIDPNFIGEYQEGFIKKELKAGIQGTPGAVSKLYYQNGKYQMELTETIITNELPYLFEAFYSHKHMDNTLKCEFEPLSENQTLYKTYVEYTRIEWVLPRLIALLLPSMYKKPARKWMENFKHFVENKTD